MALMKIKCGHCKGHWEIYQRGSWNADENRVCPHCGEMIDRQTWRNQILYAFGAFIDANKELVNDGTREDLYSFSVEFLENTCDT